MKRHNLNKHDVPINCDKCGEEFSSLEHYKSHLNKDHPEFNCHTCGAKFTKKILLDTHMESKHQEDIPCPQCGVALHMPLRTLSASTLKDFTRKRSSKSVPIVIIPHPFCQIWSLIGGGSTQVSCWKHVKNVEVFSKGWRSTWKEGVGRKDPRRRWNHFNVHNVQKLSSEMTSWRRTLSEYTMGSRTKSAQIVPMPLTVTTI